MQTSFIIYNDENNRRQHQRSRSAAPVSRNDIEVLFSDIPEEDGTSPPPMSPSSSRTGSARRVRGPNALSSPQNPKDKSINVFATTVDDLNPEVPFGQPTRRERASSSAKPFTSMFSGLLGSSASPEQQAQTPRAPHTRARSVSAAVQPSISSSIPDSVTTFEQKLCIWKFAPDSIPKYLIPHLVATTSFFNISRSKNGVTIVVPEEFNVRLDPGEPEPSKDAGWRCFKLDTSASVSQGMIVAAISKLLSDQRITYNIISVSGNQYVFVKNQYFSDVSKILTDAGYEVRVSREKLTA